jgi:hypothetical protein
MDNEKITIDMETKGTKDDVVTRRFGLVKEIAIKSAMTQLQDPRTYQFAAGIGLWQGLKYRGSLGQGLKAGLAGLIVVTGCNVVVNLVRNSDDIKDA